MGPPRGGGYGNGADSGDRRSRWGSNNGGGYRRGGDQFRSGYDFIFL